MKIKLNLGGTPVEAEKLQVVHTIEERWSTYKLEDGSILKIKLVVSDVFKLPEPDPLTGLPQFLVKSSNVMTVEPSLPEGDIH